MTKFYLPLTLLAIINSKSYARNLAKFYNNSTDLVENNGEYKDFLLRSLISDDGSETTTMLTPPGWLKFLAWTEDSEDDSYPTTNPCGTIPKTYEIFDGMTKEMSINYESVHYKQIKGGPADGYWGWIHRVRTCPYTCKGKYKSGASKEYSNKECRQLEKQGLSCGKKRKPKGFKMKPRKHCGTLICNVKTKTWELDANAGKSGGNIRVLCEFDEENWDKRNKPRRKDVVPIPENAVPQVDQNTGAKYEDLVEVDFD